MAIAKRLENFGIKKILYNNRKPSGEADQRGYQYVDMPTLLKDSDFVICTCAATKETERIFNLDKFRQMKADSIFINVSRGVVVNQEDLAFALKNKLIGAAGLDVTTPEPLPVDHELFKLANCCITPHIASADTSTRVKMATISATNLVNALNNEPLLHQIQIS
jgi:glyoxylate/hydroxypyruvate reductase